MNKTELITAVATKTGKSKKDVETVITSLIETIVETVSNEEKVHLVGFGTFASHYRKERKGCDPRTRERIVISAAKIPTFKFGKCFKDAVNKNLSDSVEE